MVLKRRLKLYLFIVFGISYFSWIIAIIISNINSDSGFILPLHLIGGASPLIATIVYLIKTKGWNDYFNRLKNIKETTLVSWLITFSPVIILVISSIIVFGKVEINPEFPSTLILYSVGLLFFGPLPEELGWRGILFNDLNELSFKKAQIYMAVIWFVWHLPLFFIIGTYQNDLGIVSIDFLFFAINIFIQSFILGYLFSVGKKNIILPILFHYFVNLFGELLLDNIFYEILTIILYSIVLLFIYILSKRKQFS
ncbi:lysostaphin resistance A-like protein [Candidatus Izemoplasma sp. B36]|uniref:CPBP family intramembrane glutamic endopeptidase n=1 Tax=Candidatus Izemoplasma sp. B36 TaxID=3242468 RepID=UPI00355732F4